MARGHRQHSSATSVDSATSPAASQSSDSDREESADEDPIESLVVGRAKRVTAGNRLSALVEKEQDDEIELLFAEDEQEEDGSFDEEEEAGSDANLDDSSSDDQDDQGPAHGDEDLTGEKELQRQDRQAKRKRKAQEMAKRPGMGPKRVKIASAAPDGVTPPTLAEQELAAAKEKQRKKKKSERVSWVATAADAPTRISSRKQTMQNREVVHERLVQNEKQRLKVMRQMEVAQKRKDALKPKALTQAQRLEEAARVERKNAKSLNRWEESEKRRAEEQKAKLEALHNRQLSGPVISWWSGMARWVNGKMERVGSKDIQAMPAQADGKKPALKPPDLKPLSDEKDIQEAEKANPSSISQEPQATSHPPSSLPARLTTATTTTTPVPVQSSNVNHPLSSHIPHSADVINEPLMHIAGGPPITTESTTKAPISSQPFTTQVSSAIPPPVELHVPPKSVSATTDNPLLISPAPATAEYASRNLVALKNFDANAQRIPELIDSVLLMKKKTIRLHKAAAEHCAITGQLAHFRDPVTGLPYATPYAYKAIGRLAAGDFQWSNLLDCYVGHGSHVARGVPERFWKR